MQQTYHPHFHINLNTSHVNVNPGLTAVNSAIKANLNTSHVNVNHVNIYKKRR